MSQLLPRARPPDNLDDIRDDERALSIESGDSLIPWMGDPSLRIDRC